MRHAVGSASLLLLALFSGGGGGAGAERSAQSLGEMPGPTVACSPARVHAILAAVASANRAGVAVRGLLHPRLRAGQIGIRLRGGSEAVGDSEAGEQDEFRPRAFDDDPGSIVREDQSDEEEMPEQGLDDDEEEEEEEGQGQGRGTNDFNDINAMQDDYWRDQIEMIKEQDAANDDFWCGPPRGSAGHALNHALWNASKTGDEAAVSRLLEEGAQVDSADPEMIRNTALHCASLAGHEGVVRILLEADADPTLRTLWNSTALHYATSRGHAAVVRELLKHGADPQEKDLCGFTALDRANVVCSRETRDVLADAINRISDAPIDRHKVGPADLSWSSEGFDGDGETSSDWSDDAIERFMRGEELLAPPKEHAPRKRRRKP